MELPDSHPVHRSRRPAEGAMNSCEARVSRTGPLGRRLTSAELSQDLMLAGRQAKDDPPDQPVKDRVWIAVRGRAGPAGQPVQRPVRHVRMPLLATAFLAECSVLAIREPCTSKGAPRGGSCTRTRKRARASSPPGQPGAGDAASRRSCAKLRQGYESAITEGTDPRTRFLSRLTVARRMEV
jgi:hypothetical protein